MAQRRAQVVRHRVGEGLELLVGGVQLRGAVEDALLELGVEALDLVLGRLTGGEVDDAAVDARHVALVVAYEVGAHEHGEGTAVDGSRSREVVADRSVPCELCHVRAAVGLVQPEKVGGALAAQVHLWVYPEDAVVRRVVVEEHAVEGHTVVGLAARLDHLTELALVGAQLGRGELALGDVLHDHVDGVDALVLERGGGDLHVYDGAVQADDPLLDQRHVLALVPEPVDAVAHAWMAVRVEQFERGLAQELFGRGGAKQPQTGLVRQHDAVFAVDEDRHRGVIDERPVALLALTDLGGGLRLARAPEEQNPDTGKDDKEEGEPRREPAARADRPQHFTLVFVGDDEPGRATDRLERRHDRDAAVVDAFGHSPPAADRLGRGQVGVVRRQGQPQRRSLAVAQLVEVDDLIAAAFHEHGLARLARQRPVLDEEVEEAAGVDVQDHGRDGVAADVTQDRRRQLEASLPLGVQVEVG